MAMMIPRHLLIEIYYIFLNALSKILAPEQSITKRLPDRGIHRRLPFDRRQQALQKEFLI
jgi:hypothetical protein